MHAIVEIIRRDMRHVPHEERQTFAALYEAAGVVRPQVAVQGQVVLAGRRSAPNDRLNLALVSYEDPTAGVVAGLGRSGVRDGHDDGALRSGSDVLRAPGQLGVRRVSAVGAQRLFFAARRTFALRFSAYTLQITVKILYSFLFRPKLPCSNWFSSLIGLGG